MVKIKLTTLIITSLLFQFNAYAQIDQNDDEKNFNKLREKVASLLAVDPGTSKGNKYVAYSFQIIYGEEIEFIFPANTPYKIIYNSKRIDKSDINIAKKELSDFIEKQNITLENKKRILYSVLHIWEGNMYYDLKDNLEEALTQIFNEGINFSEISNLRIEKPIVVSKFLMPTK